MAEESISQEFRLKNIDKTNYFIEEIDQNELMAKKHKTFCTTFSFQILWLLDVFQFLLLLLCLVYLYELSYAIGLKNFAITAGIKKYEAMIKKKKKKSDKIVFLAKSK